MSIYVAITRFEAFGQNDGNEISPDEWLTLVDSLPDFREPLPAERGGGAHERVWTEGAVPWSFWWSDGQIEVKNPDMEVLARMFELADVLQAGVVSENEDHDDTQAELEDRNPPDSAAEQKSPSGDATTPAAGGVPHDHERAERRLTALAAGALDRVRSGLTKLLRPRGNRTTVLPRVQSGGEDVDTVVAQDRQPDPEQSGTTWTREGPNRARNAVGVTVWRSGHKALAYSASDAHTLHLDVEAGIAGYPLTVHVPHPLQWTNGVPLTGAETARMLTDVGPALRALQVDFEIIRAPEPAGREYPEPSTIIKDFRGKPVHFQGRNLDLREYALEGAQITGRLVDCIGEGVSFEGAVLSGVRIEATPGFGASVSFRGCNFRGARLENVFFGPRNLDLSDAVFADARLDSVTFKLAKLPGADFSSAHLKNCSFTNGRLDRCNFRQAKLSHVSLERATLVGADFTGAMFAKLEWCGEPDFAGAIIADELRYQFGTVRQPLRRVNRLLSEPDLSPEMRSAVERLRDVYRDLLSGPEAMLVGREMTDAVPPDLFPVILKRLVSLPDEP